MRASSSRAPSLALAGLVAAAAASLAVAGRGIPTPWILIDELLHSELAQAFGAPPFRVEVSAPAGTYVHFWVPS